MDFTEITAVRGGPLARARRHLAMPTAAPSPRALLAVLVSAFMLGGVLSALLFVGVWRHTAAEADQAHAGQRAAGQALHANRVRLAHAERDLAAARAQITAVRTQRRALASELSTRRRVDRRIGTSLPPRLQAVTGDADRLAHETAKLESALATLRDYLRNASATGVDPAFLETQVRYLATAAGTTRATAQSIAAQAARAETTAAQLRQKR